jgi:hypothetical protein
MCHAGAVDSFSLSVVQVGDDEMPPPLSLAAVAFISSQNHPILVRSLTPNQDDLLKYHYLAHTSLDVIDEHSEPFSNTSGAINSIS